MCTHRERSALEMPQNAEHIKWTTEGAVKGGVQSLPSIPRRYASVNCRDMSVSGECAAFCRKLRWYRGVVYTPSLNRIILC